MRRTLFLSVSDIRKLVAAVGLGNLTRLLVDRLRADFVRWDEFEKSPRTANYLPVGVIELMPISDATRFSFKYVSGHPANRALGMYSIVGFGCLADFETGWPMLLSEMTILTAIRTAATSALAAEALANPGPSTMAMIGNGAQSEFQAIGFYASLGVRKIHLYDTRPQATARLTRNLGYLRDLELVSCSSVSEAVKGVSIVTTCTAEKKRAAILVPEMIEPGMHINGVGGDCPGKTELHPDVLRDAKVFVELTAQTRVEGDIQQMPMDFPVTELWEVLAGRSLGRQFSEEVTVFDSVGFSLEDFSTLSLVYELAVSLGFGSDIDLAPPAENEGGLFGLLDPPTM